MELRLISRLARCVKRPNHVRTFFTGLSEDHRMLQETCRNFAKKHIEPVAASNDETKTFPKDVIEKLGDMGLMGIHIPQENGGSGLDTLAYSIAIEEISKACGGTGTITAVNHLYLSAVSRWGTKEQIEKFCKPFTTGKKVACYALSEPDHGSDAGAITTSAKHKNGKVTLNGAKAWITNAGQGGAVCVFATTDPEKKHKGINCYLVPIPSQGFAVLKLENKLGIRASTTGQIAFDNVEIPEEYQLGKSGEGFKIAMQALDDGRIGIASQALGIGQAALNLALRYAQERKTFGQIIGKHQSVMIKLATMETKLQSARMLTWYACHLKDTEQPFGKYASMAKLSASRAANFCTFEAIQILGGMGFVKDVPAERHYRDARITEIYEGTSEIQELVIANHLLKENAI